MMGSSTGDDGNNELASTKAAAATTTLKCEGVEFTVTERNEVAEVTRGGGGAAPRVLDGESFFDVATGTRRHFVDVQGQAEAMLFLVSVREDQRRIVAVSRHGNYGTKADAMSSLTNHYTEQAADRPSMTEVISMITNGNVTLPDPKQPGFLSMLVPNETDIAEETCSLNGLSAPSLTEDSTNCGAIKEAEDWALAGFQPFVALSDLWSRNLLQM